VYPADRAVLSEPALAGGVDQPAALWALRPGHPLEDHFTQAVPHQTSSAGGIHHPILLPARPAPADQPPGRLEDRSQRINVALIWPRTGTWNRARIGLTGGRAWLVGPCGTSSYGGRSCGACRGGEWFRRPRPRY